MLLAALVRKLEACLELNEERFDPDAAAPRSSGSRATCSTRRSRRCARAASSARGPTRSTASRGSRDVPAVQVVQRFAETWALLERVAGAGLSRRAAFHGLVHPNQATGESWRLVSLGGGPGFELLAADWFVKWWVASGGKVRHRATRATRRATRRVLARNHPCATPRRPPLPLPGRRHFVPRERQVRGRAAAEQSRTSRSTSSRVGTRTPRSFTPRGPPFTPPAELGRVRPRAVPTHRAIRFSHLSPQPSIHAPPTHLSPAGTSTRSATDSRSGTCTAAAPRRCTPAARAPARRRRTSTRRSRRRRRRSRRSRCSRTTTWRHVTPDLTPRIPHI